MRKLWEHIRKFRPPLVLSCVLAVFFSTASLVSVATDVGQCFSPILNYGIYICAAVSLTFAVWAIIRFCQKKSPLQQVKSFAHRHVLAGRMVDDFSFRTVTFTYASFGSNVLFALAKGTAGWVSGSWWLISFSAYYLVLCASKFFLLRDSRKLDKLQDQSQRERLEWQAYRVCGALLMVMTIALFGIVILIVTHDNKFVYYGILIFVVALYDFTCLTTAIIYMVRNRRQHSPIIVAIKTIQFATALVSMLSLQTAMFASFGGEFDGALQLLMNLCTGGAVCVILLIMGIAMMVKATKKNALSNGGNNMINILIVEDDTQLNRMVCTYLNDSGFRAKGCLNANDAYDEMYNNLYELIISDIMMPEVDGFEFAENVRRVNKHIPILFMSAKDDLPTKQKGFKLGIDDYMVKPVELEELKMRVQALLRRANIETERKLIVGNLELDADGMTAEISGEDVPMTTREFNILYKLLSYPKKTFSRAQLMDEFWGIDSETSLRAVDVYVTKLRDKFSSCDGFQIVTVRGLGYKAVLS